MDRLDLTILKKICAQRHWTIGTAESCTGGLLAAMITSEPSVSSFFRGGVVSYDGQVKADILEVPKTTMKTMGEVSLPVATAMARGARKKLKCDWAVSITGIAGPTGGTPQKPVGTVCFAVVGPGFEASSLKYFKTTAVGENIRKDIQRQAALFAFDFLLSAMN
jgi:PncC family amidohydrolase